MLTRRHPLLLLLLVIVAAAFVAERCDQRPTRGGNKNSTPAETRGTGAIAPVQVRLTPVVTLSRPVAMAVRAGDPALYFAEKGGRVRSVAEGRSELILDVSEQVSSGGEQGLLGLTFSPDGTRLYVNFTDREGTTRIVEYAFADGRAARGSARELLVVNQPFANHNGGNLVFGPDGLLWIGLGDGGSANDPGNRAQTRDTLLGKLLRINPRPDGPRPYSIPADNPFVSAAGWRPEIWAYGLRNPWRYSFDRETGDLWMGDVGQNAVEEINLEPAGSPGGRNYGWSRFEGTRQVTDRSAPGAVAPVFEFGHGTGDCSVTGGYVYRGQRVASLSGVYVYSDFCGGGLRALRRGDDGRVEDLGSLREDVSSVASFGEDGAGELYVLSLKGPVHRIDPP